MIIMERLEKRKIEKNGKEMSRGHEGCKRKHCTLQTLLREKNRTEGMITESEREKHNATNFDEILLNYEMEKTDRRRLGKIESAISSIQEKGDCECVQLEGLMPGYVIDEMINNPKPRPKPESEQPKL